MNGIERIGGVAIIAACLVAAASRAPAQAADNPPDLSGMWWGGTEPQPFSVVGGGEPPLTAAGRERYAETSAETREILENETDPFELRKCVGLGSPRIWAQPYPFEIMQTPTDLALIYEHNHNFRIVYLNEPQIDDSVYDVDWGYWGHSVGHWEDDTLVVDSVRIRERTVLNDSGLPHTDDMRLTESFRLIDDDTLEVTVTIDDPEYYSEPWSTRWTFERHPELHMEDFVCGYGLYRTRYHKPEAEG